MISIVILFSPDREDLWGISRELLLECRGVGDCQLILSCDRAAPTHPGPAVPVIVDRRRGLYCWADALNAGIERADFERILYLDCDRILPVNYLEHIRTLHSEDDFLFSSALYRLKGPETGGTVRRIRDGMLPLNDHAYPDYRLPADYDPRITGIQVGKGPFSGNCSFTKGVYRETGGVDPGFLGAGYVDQEYWFRCKARGYSFNTVQGTEIHLHHRTGMFNHLDGLWNCRYMARKHGLPIAPYMEARLKKAEKKVGDLSSYKTCQELRTKAISLMP